MRLWRAHGLGNDYLVLETGDALSPSLVRALCDRHRGVGSDGVLEPCRAESADFGLRIHNPDGTEAEKSGNGLRIFASWLVRRRGAPARFCVETPGGVVDCAVEGASVRVGMGACRVWGPEDLAGHQAWRANLGNPHAVVFGVPADWRGAGAAIEQSVPGRTNVQFVEMQGSEPFMRVWERGAGETQASGSSACAVAAVCVQRGVCASPVTVRMPGGALRVEVGVEGLVMSGPVEGVGLVEIDANWLAARTAF
jgi:diaminopimelate epimerase